MEKKHRQVYKEHYGDIPPNCDIHHLIPTYKCKQIGIDPNFPENLIAVTREEHIAIHLDRYFRKGNKKDLKAWRILKAAKNIFEGGEYMREWYQTEAGEKNRAKKAVDLGKRNKVMKFFGEDNAMNKPGVRESHAKGQAKVDWVAVGLKNKETEGWAKSQDDLNQRLKEDNPNKILVECLTCNKTGAAPGMKRWHKNHEIRVI